MSSALIGRLVWKEYRELRAVWVSIFALGFIAQIAFWLWSPPPAASGIFAIGLAVPTAYAIGAGAAMFASENESQTIQFLRALPATSRVLGLAKVLFAVTSVLLMQALLWLSAAALFRGRFPEPATIRMLWQLWILASLEGLAWSIFWSLLLRSTLQATAVALIATGFSSHLALHTLGAFDPRHITRDFELWSSRLVVLGVLVPIDFLLISDWFLDRRPTWRFTWLLGRHASVAPPALECSKRLPTRLDQLLQLSWQSWREGKPAMIVLAVLGLIDPVISAWIASGRRTGALNGTVQLFLHPQWLYWIVACVCGLFAFRFDQQQGRRRFLAERGISPRLVWLARQLTWCSFLAGWALCEVLIMSAWTTLIRPMPFVWSSLLVGVMLLFTRYPVTMSLAYAAGQLISMSVTSKLLSVIWGLLLAACVLFHAGQMQALQLSWLWSVLPILLAMMIATWFRAPNWLMERNDLRSWIYTVAILVLPASAILRTIPYVRANQVPPVDLAQSAEDAAAKVDKKSRSIPHDYLEASMACKSYIAPPGRIGSSPFDSLPPLTDGEKRALVDCDISIKQAMQASRRNDFTLEDDSEIIDGVFEKMGRPGCILLLAARAEQAEGNLDQSLEYYLATLRIVRQLRTHPYGWQKSCHALLEDTLRLLSDWAVAEGQTSERMHRALAAVAEIRRTLPSPGIFVEELYRERGLISLKKPHGVEFPNLNQFPWERTRARRLLDQVASSNRQFVRAFEETLDSNQSIMGLFPDRLEGGYRLHEALQVPLLQWRSQLTSWAQSTPSGLVYDDGSSTEARCWAEAETVSLLRVTETLLSLEGWRIEHDKLPVQLHRLVGAWLDEVPIDPFIGKAYVYFHRGLPVPLTYERYFFPPMQAALVGSLNIPGSEKQQVICAVNSGNTGYQRFVLLAMRPFVWSSHMPGSVKQLVIYSDESENRGYRFADKRTVASELFDSELPDPVLQAGWPSPIPAVVGK